MPDRRLLGSALLALPVLAVLLIRSCSAAVPPGILARVSLTLSPQTLVGGGISTGAITVRDAYASPGSVALISSDPQTAPVPARTPLAAGAATFTIQTAVISAPRTVRICCVYGHVRRCADLVVQPSPTAGLQPSTTVDLGLNASLHGLRPFPDDNPWNTRVDTAPVDPNSAALIRTIGLTGHLHPDFGSGVGWTGIPFGIPYLVVPGSTQRVPVSFDYVTQSDPGPYPIPLDAPIEGGPDSTGDRHVIVLDRDQWRLYEIYNAVPNGSGWKTGSGAVFDLSSNALRPAGWTSADAAGLPIFPGLVRYDEVVEQKAIQHALRFTVVRTRKAYIAPATHFASSNSSTALPPMGMRVRLKQSFDISGFPPGAKVILQAMKTYGMILADNGSNWFLSGTADARWDDTELNALKRVAGSNFEVVKMGPMTTAPATAPGGTPTTPPAGPPPALTGISLSESTVQSYVRPKATVSLSGAVQQGFVTVALTSSNPALVSVPASINIWESSTSASFDVATTAATAPTTVTLTATLAGVSQSITLTVLPK